EPEIDRARSDREGRHRDLPRTLPAAPRARPGEEGHDRPGRADLVAEVEVVGLRVVEVHRALDEPQPEEPDVEIEVPLRIARDRGDVVDAEDLGHRYLTCAGGRAGQGPGRSRYSGRRRGARAVGGARSRLQLDRSPRGACGGAGRLEKERRFPRRGKRRKGRVSDAASFKLFQSGRTRTRT